MKTFDPILFKNILLSMGSMTTKGYSFLYLLLFPPHSGCRRLCSHKRPGAVSSTTSTLLLFIRNSLYCTSVGLTIKRPTVRKSVSPAQAAVLISPANNWSANPSERLNSMLNKGRPILPGRTAAAISANRKEKIAIN